MNYYWNNFLYMKCSLILNKMNEMTEMAQSSPRLRAETNYWLDIISVFVNLHVQSKIKLK